MSNKIDLGVVVIDGQHYIASLEFQDETGAPQKIDDAITEQFKTQTKQYIDALLNPAGVKALAKKYGYITQIDAEGFRAEGESGTSSHIIKKTDRIWEAFVAFCGNQFPKLKPMLKLELLSKDEVKVVEEINKEGFLKTNRASLEAIIAKDGENLTAAELALLEDYKSFLKDDSLSYRDLVSFLDSELGL